MQFKDRSFMPFKNRILIKVVLKHMRNFFFISFKLLPFEFVPLRLNVSKIKFELICSIFTGVAGLSKFNQV